MIETKAWPRRDTRFRTRNIHLMPAVNIPFSDLASTPDLLNMDGDQIGNWMRACFAHAKPYQVEIEKVKSISMLAPDVLFYIGLLACVLRGRIIEIGPYIGGSTVALASGSGTAHPPVITIEAGGSYETHPDLPSSDILGDLRINLENFEVVDRVNIIEGFAKRHSSVFRGLLRPEERAVGFDRCRR